MATNYTEQELDGLSKIFKKDLVTLFRWIDPLGGPQEALALRKDIKTAIDTGGYVSGNSSAVGTIVNSENFNVPAFALGGKIMKDRGAKLILRTRSYYQYLIEYEKKAKERKKKDKISKVKNPKEKKLLKQVEEKKKKADSLLFKTPSQIADEFSVRVDTNITKAIYDFQTRWDNNDEKVGNVFVSNYADLKKEFENSLNEVASPYMKIAKYYNEYATKYGFGDLVKDSLDCLIKNTPLSVVKEAYDEAQKEIDAFLKDADTVITESLNIVDSTIGIVEEGYDASKEISKDLKDYKSSLKDADIPTTQDAVRNKMRQQFLNVLLPAITTQVSNVLDAIVNSVCDENQVAVFDIPSIVDENALRNQLKGTYGIGETTLQDYLSMLVDVSGFLTPVELCELFNGESKDQTLDMVINFIAAFYAKIYPRMDTRQRVSSFFVLIGSIADTNFCRKIDFNAFNETFCGGDDEYSIALRDCLIKRNPELANETRQAYLANKKKQIKDALAFSYFPLDMRADQAAINKVFEDIEKQQTAEPLTKLAMEFKSKYEESLINMSSNFIANYEITSVKEGFIEEKLAKVKESLDADEFLELVEGMPVIVSKMEKQILPNFIESLFVGDSDIADNRSSSPPNVTIDKRLNFYHASSKNLQSVIENILGMDVANVAIDPKKLFFNQELISPYYIRNIKHQYGYPSAGKQKNIATLDYRTNICFSGGTNQKPSFIEMVDGADTQQHKISYEETNSNKDNTSASENYFKKLSNNNLPIFKTALDLYRNNFQATYNELVNVCMNSIFAKKLTIGQASSGDSGKVSGLELIRLSPDLSCIEGLDLNFDLINFENLARQVANLDILEFNPKTNDEAEEREKFFTNLMMFKTSVLDFVIKSIFLFSEFSFEENDVDDTMVDYVYVQLFRELFRKDQDLKKKNEEFMSLPKTERDFFLENVGFDKFSAEKATSTLKGYVATAASQRKAIFENIIQKVKDDKPSETDINITYDVAQTLLYFYNINNKNNKTESFCEAVRNLIRKEISNLSKAIKDVIYTDRQKQAKAFNIEDRFIEKKLNLLPYKTHQKLKYPKITDTDAKTGFPNYIDATIQKFCSEIPTYHYPYFRPTSESDKFVEDLKLANIVQSQMGGEAFLLTRFSEFDTAKGKAEVEVVSCFFNTSVNESNSTLKSKFKSYEVAEGPLAMQVYEAKDAKGLPAKTVVSTFTVIDEVKELEELFTGYTTDAEVGKIAKILMNSNVPAYTLNTGGMWGKLDKEFGKTIANDIWKNKKRNPFLVHEIEKEFTKQFKNEYRWGTLKESLKEDLSTEQYTLVIQLLEAAQEYVRKNKGIIEPAKFIRYVNQKDTEKTAGLQSTGFDRKRLGFSMEEYEAVKKGGADILYPSKLPRGTDGGYRLITFGNYPFTPLSQFFRRGKNAFLVDDYKHRNTPQNSPVLAGTTDRSLVPKIKNSSILAIFKDARQRITPDAIALIGEYRRRKIYYNPNPIAKISLDLSNYGDFKTNFKREYKKDATEQDYIDICLKPQIIEEFKKKQIITEEYYRNNFPVKKMLSHIACNMNNYVELINNVEPQIGNVTSKKITTMRSLSDFSSLNVQNLLAMGSGLAALTAGQAQALVRANANLSAMDIISMTNSFDFTTYFIKTSIKNYLSIIEQSDMNIKISKQQANMIGNVMRQIYSKSQKIADSANKIGAIFGADTAGKGMPSQQELVKSFRGLKILFNPPTAPFAIANLWLGVPPTSGFANWLAYLILEPLLIAIELAEDAGLMKQLKDALFDGDDDNSFAAPEKNFKDACEIANAKRLLSNPVVPDENNQKTRKTSGGEYLLPDGKRYVGEYHVHKDGTAMSLGKHENESIILTPILERDDL